MIHGYLRTNDLFCVTFITRVVYRTSLSEIRLSTYHPIKIKTRLAVRGSRPNPLLKLVQKAVKPKKKKHCLIRADPTKTLDERAADVPVRQPTTYLRVFFHPFATCYKPLHENCPSTWTSGEERLKSLDREDSSVILFCFSWLYDLNSTFTDKFLKKNLVLT